MLIDCQSCPVRGRRCQECMVTAMLATPIPRAAPPDPVAPPERLAAELPLDVNERAAVAAFVQAGLVDSREAAGLRAQREPWGAYRAVS